jgi:hypothetical protein
MINIIFRIIEDDNPDEGKRAFPIDFYSYIQMQDAL